MAVDTVYGITLSDVWPQTGADVWFKWAWADPWELCPFAQPGRVELVSAPDVSRATVWLDYGYWYRPERRAFDYDPFWDLRNAYVKIEAWNYWGSLPVFYGLVEASAYKPTGHYEWPAGEQSIECVGPEQMLARIEITKSKTKWGWVDRLLHFNGGDHMGRAFGNRSSTVDENGAYYFSDDGDVWTNRDILDYVLINFVGTLCATPWYVYGDALEALEGIEQEVRMRRGMNCWMLINELMNRRRGIGARAYMHEGGGVVHAYSLSDAAVELDGATLPANWRQIDMDTTGLRFAQHEIQTNPSSRFDEIHVRGERIISVFTLSVADATLEAGWDATQETAYKAGASSNAINNDAERKTDKFELVYQNFRVPDAWNGYAGDGAGGTQSVALPEIDDWGEDVPDVAAAQALVDTSFERGLPVDMEGMTGPTAQQRAFFGVVKHPITNKFHMLHATDAAQIDNTGITPSDSNLSVNIAPAINHIFAKNHWTGAQPSSRAPMFDWETLAFTVALKTDRFIEIVLRQAQASDNARVKYIDVPDCEAWYMTPGTITDVTSGALVNAVGGWIRKDIDRLRQVAMLASAWYSYERNTARVKFEMAMGDLVGCMLTSFLGPEGRTYCGTAITRQVYEFPDDCHVTTSIETHYYELEFGDWKR